ncbi:hypothetical protein AAHZ94_34425, partial [Streptomyces sp. HSW2009]|uniref:hypothetical protein n=1 Tax=Streptomyces sp. HSW2009 TaxID=3142890 RepID=UPI0032EABEFA
MVRQVARGSAGAGRAARPAPVPGGGAPGARPPPPAPPHPGGGGGPAARPRGWVRLVLMSGQDGVSVGGVVLVVG